MTPPLRLRLRQSRAIAPTTQHLSFDIAEGDAFAWLPGQFMHVFFDTAGGATTKRAYSIATRTDTPQSDAATIEFVVSRVEGGLGSTHMATLQPGDTIPVSAPQGRFCLLPGDSNGRYLLVATGTGVAPYRAMLPQLLAAHAARGIDVVLLQGARTPADLLFADEFDAFAAAHPWFRYVPCLSRQSRGDAGAFDHAGHVQTAFAQHAPDPGRDIAYLCGNPNMVDAAFEALKLAGLAPAAIRREKYVSLR